MKIDLNVLKQDLSSRAAFGGEARNFKKEGSRNHPYDTLFCRKEELSIESTMELSKIQGLSILGLIWDEESPPPKSLLDCCDFWIQEEIYQSQIHDQSFSANQSSALGAFQKSNQGQLATSFHFPFSIGNEPKLHKGKPALFLDRDGVVILDKNFLKDPMQVELCEGIWETIQDANSKQMPVIVVSNQSGLGRGYFDWNDLQRVHEKMLQLLAMKNCFIDATFVAPYIFDSPNPILRLQPQMRKPRPGMLLAAQAKFGIDLAKSSMHGDKESDRRAAQSAGINQFILASGK